MQPVEKFSVCLCKQYKENISYVSVLIRYGFLKIPVLGVTSEMVLAGITHSAHVSCPIGPVLLGSAFSPIALFPHSPPTCRHSEQTYIAVAGARACKELINSQGGI